MNRELRQKLTDMTFNHSVPDHPAILEKLRAEFGHSVEIVASEHPIQKYTCGVHAFLLVGDPTYMRVATFGLGGTFAGNDFISFVLERGFIEPLDSIHGSNGDLIMYFQEGVFQHVGRLITPDRVLSKWGIGYLYKHGLLEVPSTYGEDVRVFKGPSKEQCFEMFIAYAEAKGFTFGEQ